MFNLFLVAIRSLLIRFRLILLHRLSQFILEHGFFMLGDSLLASLSKMENCHVSIRMCLDLKCLNNFTIVEINVNRKYNNKKTLQNFGSTLKKYYIISALPDCLWNVSLAVYCMLYCHYKAMSLRRFTITSFNDI